MHVRKLHAGAAGPYTWETDGAVLEVPDAFGDELISITGAGFVQVPFHQMDTEAEHAKGAMSASEAAAVLKPGDRDALVAEEKAGAEADEKAAEKVPEAVAAVEAKAAEKDVADNEEEAKEEEAEGASEGQEPEAEPAPAGKRKAQSAKESVPA